MLIEDNAPDGAAALEPLPPALEADADLIARIIRDFHVPHLGDLVRILALAQRVEARHGDRDDAPQGLADVLAGLFEALSIHQAREESVLFPMMLRGAGRLAEPIAAMAGDHHQVEKALVELARLTRGFVPPADACGSWRSLYEQCRDFDAALREHIRLEEQVLFPRFA